MASRPAIDDLKKFGLRRAAKGRTAGGRGQDNPTSGYWDGRPYPARHDRRATRHCADREQMCISTTGGARAIRCGPSSDW
jgi:hypothetical protein